MLQLNDYVNALALCGCIFLWKSGAGVIYALI